MASLASSSSPYLGPSWPSDGAAFGDLSSRWISAVSFHHTGQTWTSMTGGLGRPPNWLGELFMGASEPLLSVMRRAPRPWSGNGYRKERWTGAYTPSPRINTCSTQNDW